MQSPIFDTHQSRAMATFDTARVLSIKKQAEIEQWIRTAMVRNGVEAPDSIGIEVNGRKVTLTGRVGSWVQLRTAAQTARSAPGIRMVDDQLQIHRR